jgi:hypothetical protein
MWSSILARVPFRGVATSPFEQLVEAHLERGCPLAVAQHAARARLEEAGLWDSLLHPRGRAGEFEGKGEVRPLRTRSGREIRVRPYETNREQYLHQLAASKPAKFTREQIQKLKHIKNVLKDPKTPTNVKVELAGGAMGLIVGTAVPLIPGDEVISAAVISHALKRSRGEHAAPLVTHIGDVARGAGLGTSSPGTTHVAKTARPQVHLHTQHRAGHAMKPPPLRVQSKRQFKPGFAGSRY